jgi:hypothetical protein
VSSGHARFGVLRGRRRRAQAAARRHEGRPVSQLSAPRAPNRGLRRSVTAGLPALADAPAARYRALVSDASLCALSASCSTVTSPAARPPSSATSPTALPRRRDHRRSVAACSLRVRGDRVLIGSLRPRPTTVGFSCPCHLRPRHGLRRLPSDLKRAHMRPASCRTCGWARSKRCAVRGRTEDCAGGAKDADARQALASLARM